jgi:hypothetical protein
MTQTNLEIAGSARFFSSLLEYYSRSLHRITHFLLLLLRTQVDFAWLISLIALALLGKVN